MTSKEIRQQFLDFFASKAHTIVDSSPVVPLDDPTLMFTNAGMNQFKDVFLGTGSRPYTRVADTQKCIRAGGKHNDLDDVGQDTYHHTFFEMLGNWSFGDYFKKEAIEWAWELLTEVWGIEKSRLHATYFEGNAAEGLEPDTEAAELWQSVTDIDPTHVHPGSKKDNFWEMGDTGPCGPCSEIHIDLTPDKSGSPLVNAGDPRVIELWNLVFIQFNRDATGKLTPLPAKHVDTGMGFERTVAVLQGKDSNYDSDVWTPVFEAIQKRTGAPPYRGTLPGNETGGTEGRRDEGTKGAGEVGSAVRTTDADTDPRRDHEVGSAVRTNDADTDPSRDREGAVPDPNRPDAGRDEGAVPDPIPPLPRGGEGGVGHDQVMIDVSYRVIADHVRCLTFALTDGATPDNEGRGYVLRRILRRGIRYGRQYLNMHEPFMCDLVEPVVRNMEDGFPELRTGPDRQHPRDNVAYVAEIIRDEEESFGKTLERGIKLFEEAADFARRRHHGKITGEDAFKLHDTYGFPIDLTELMAEEQGLTIDIGEYERLMGEARERARSSLKTSVDESVLLDDLGIGLTTEFVGYGLTRVDKTPVTAILRDNAVLPKLACGESAAVVLARTPFYPEQGGQVSDKGVLKAVNGEWEFEVTYAKKVGMCILHYGTCRKGEVSSYLSVETGPGAQQLPKSGHLSRDYPHLWASATVNNIERSCAMKNHTATHMLNWALREVLGDHIQQKGSLVDPEKTRFDFSHNKAVTAEQAVRIEQLVNERIEADQPVYAREVDQKKALEINTLRAVFGEKYPDIVRVISIGAEIGEEDRDDPNTLLGNPKDPKWMQYPVEFCGGTHLQSSGEAERFVLASEEAVAKGIRRIVGITGEAARRAEAAGEQLLAEADDPSRDRKGAVREFTPPIPPLARGGEADETAGMEGRRDEGTKGTGDVGSASRTMDNGGDGPHGGPNTLAEQLAAFQQQVNDAVIPIRVRHELRELIAKLQKKAKKQEKQAASATGAAVIDRAASLLKSAETVGGVVVVVGEVPPAAPDALRGAIDWVRNKTDASAVLLASVSRERVTLVAGMSKAAVEKGLHAGNLIKEIAPLVGGKGGGRPDMAQGGGNNPPALPQALDHAKTWLNAQLA